MAASSPRRPEKRRKPDHNRWRNEFGGSTRIFVRSPRQQRPTPVSHGVRETDLRKQRGDTSKA